MLHSIAECCLSTGVSQSKNIVERPIAAYNARPVLRLEIFDMADHPAQLVLHPASPPPTALLLKLPAELRNQIYELCITADVRILKVHSHVKLRTDERFSYNEDRHAPFWVTEPALLHVSRAIRAEASSIFYGMQIFRVYHAFTLRPWLFCLGAERRALLRRVECYQLTRWSEHNSSSTVNSYGWTARELLSKSTLQENLLKMELFDLGLQEEGLGVPPGAMHWCRPSLCRLLPAPLRDHELWALGKKWWNACDVAHFLSDEDWTKYVGLRIARSNRVRRELQSSEEEELTSLAGPLVGYA